MGIFGSKEEEVRGNVEKLHDEIYNLYSSLHITVMMK
jgi:hypothetical protein